VTGATGGSGANGATGATGSSGSNGATGATGAPGGDGSDGYNSLIDLQTIGTGDVGGQCVANNGGVIIRVGLDNGDGAGTADDGTLHDDEVDEEAVVCNPP